MSQLTQALTNAVTRNRELLSTLAQTDYADKTLQQNASYISDLDSQIKATDKELKKLHTQTEDERKDHVKYRDSTFKRYAHKLGGSKGQAKFASKSEKEEREFLQAWQQEREAEERRAELQRALTTANSDRQRFEADKARNTSAQHDLDQLYASIFSGPTPEVPGEDQLETAVQNAKQHLEQTQSAYNAENASLEALRRVENRMQTAAAAMQEAIDSSRLDIIGMGGSFADMMERDALSKAAVALSESLRHMDEARRWQPAIVHLRTVHIDMGHMVSDVMFDNIFSDMNQHERIKGSNNQLMEAMAQLKEQLAAQVQRAKGAMEALKMARASMEEARVELQSIRAEAFERLAGGAGGGYGAAAAPPSYSLAEGGFGGYELQPGYSKV
ncbi:hypothetical protein Q7P36_007615 [Cladosporium allicinum]